MSLDLQVKQDGLLVSQQAWMEKPCPGQAILQRCIGTQKARAVAVKVASSRIVAGETHIKARMFFWF
jgi:hypothetical protein